MKFAGQLVLLFVLLPMAVSRAETPQEWIALATRIHGGFGALIPIGIRIGLDARQHLKADPRGLTVIYYSGEKAPCPCIADGIMLATQASPGQGTLTISAEKALPGLFAMSVIRNRRTGEGLRYAIKDEWLPKILDWNKTLDPMQRYQAAMNADGLFKVESLPPL